MKVNIFDIETRPISEKVREFTPPFDREGVKTGNMKPDTAKAKVDKAEGEYWEKAHEKAALHPATSEICAIGVHIEGGSHMNFIKGSERYILQQFWFMIGEQGNDIWAYYTGSNDKSSFDIRHIINRSWVHDIMIPHGIVSHAGYISSQFVDLAQIYLAGAPYPTYCSADLCARQLGVIGNDLGWATVRSKQELEKEGVTGKDFHKVLADNPELAKQYLTNDLAIERAIADVILQP